MSRIPPAETASHGRAGRQAPWRVEARAMLVLTWPLVLTQVGQTTILLTDTIMIGWLGKGALASAALGGSVFFISFILVMGVGMATAPLASQAFGARLPRQIRRVVRQGLWVIALLSLPGLVAMMFTEEILLTLGQAPAVAARAQGYANGLAWALPTAGGFVVLRSFAASVDRPGPALWVMLAGVPLNGLLNYLLIFGGFGMPRLELLGAGIASTIANGAMFTAMALICAGRRPFRQYNVFSRFWRPDWAIFRRLFVVGAPIAVTYLMEYGVFAAALILMGVIGEAAAAAHQVAIQIAALTFMVTFGISQAATVRVGQAVGRRDPRAARRAGWVAVAVGLVFMAGAGVIFLLFADVLVSPFLDPSKPGSAEVLALAAKLLLVAAAFQLVDGAQAIGVGALRGLNDTAIPMVVTIFAYWAVGFVLAAWLGFDGGLGPIGIWIGLAAGLGVAAVCHLLRFWLLMRHGRFPRSAATPARH